MLIVKKIYKNNLILEKLLLSPKIFILVHISYSILYTTIYMNICIKAKSRWYIKVDTP